MRNPEKRRIGRFFLPFLFAGIVLNVQLSVIATIVFVLQLLVRSGLLAWNQLPSGTPMLILSVISLVIGSLFAVFFIHLSLKPLQDMMRATDRVANGDYSVRVKPRGFLEFRDLGNQFNHMASELGSVELLRSDFVNNFSHEFKTPIVSIRGFAKMLQSPDLTDAERKEYLDIIIEESERLAALSTNVLELSKLEQQTILPDRTPINVSEQLRLCAAMLAAKWEQKSISFDVSGEELHTIGSEELLKQVWINLLDNAIKFSPSGGTVQLTMTNSLTCIAVSIRNEGEPIAEEAYSHLFDKFYQADTSHSGQGNGLGLSIAKRIVDLHDGTISVVSDPSGTIFTVQLPQITP